MENENQKTVKPEKKKEKKRVCEVLSCMTMYSSCVFFYPLRFADLFLPSLPLWMVSGLRDLNRPSVLHLRTFFSFFLHNRVPFHLSGEVLGPCDPEDLIDGIIFAATYLGCTHLLSERTPSKSARMQQAQEAMSRVRVSDVMHK